jgi:hypothetical protein
MSRHKPLKAQKPSVPRARGEFGFSVVEAGRMIGLGRNASYDAAKRGDIPTICIGRIYVVPRIPWLKKLGAEAAE